MVDTNNLLQFGTILRKLRVSKGWSQYRLGKMLDVDTSYVSRLESGQRAPSRQTVFAIAKVLGVENTAYYHEMLSALGYLLSKESGTYGCPEMEKIDQIFRKLDSSQQFDVRIVLQTYLVFLERLLADSRHQSA